MAFFRPSALLFWPARVLLFISLFSLFHISSCARNVTVDDTDLSVKFSDGWQTSSPGNPLNFDGSHHLADLSNSDATAEFEFTGTAVFLMSPRWPYQVGVQVSVDGSQPIAVDLKDPDRTSNDGGPETVSSAVVWGSGELENGTHVLNISFLPGKQFAAVDAIIFTSQDIDESKESTTSSLPAMETGGVWSDKTNSNPEEQVTENHSNDSLPERTIVAIVSGTLCGIAVLAFIIFLVAVLLRRRRRAKKAPSNDFRAGSPYKPPTQEEYNRSLHAQPSMGRSWATASSLTRSESNSSIQKEPLYGIIEEPILVPLPTTTVKQMAADENAAENGRRTSAASAFPNPWRTSGANEKQVSNGQPRIVEAHILPPRTLTEVMDARTYFSHVRSDSVSEEVVKSTPTAVSVSGPVRQPLPLPPRPAQVARALPIPK